MIFFYPNVGLLWATMATSLSQAMTRSRSKKILTSFHRSLLFFGLKDLSHEQSRRNLLKYLVRVEMASDWFTRIYRSILAEQVSRN